VARILAGRTGTRISVAEELFSFDAHVTVHRDKFLIIKPTRCTNFSIFIIWKEILRVSDSSSVHHQEFFTVHTAMIYKVSRKRNRTFEIARQ
jgi:hypothetical protein